MFEGRCSTRHPREAGAARAHPAISFGGSSTKGGIVAFTRRALNRNLRVVFPDRRALMGRRPLPAEAAMRSLLVFAVIAIVASALVTRAAHSFRPRPSAVENTSEPGGHSGAKEEFATAQNVRSGSSRDSETVETRTPSKGKEGSSAIKQEPQHEGTAGTSRPREREPVFEQDGEAAYYADKYQGRTTASGEPADQNELTAASRTLPLGTHVTVTHAENGKSVNVVVNDRGPNVEGRVIDLSKEAARRLEMTHDGVARVRIQARPSRQPTPELREQVLGAARSSAR
jgi:rare lipoprotein A